MTTADFWHAGSPNGHDTYFQMIRTIAISDVWANGFFIPRWSPSMAGGLGYPMFSYYGWSPYILPAALYNLGFPVMTAVNLSAILCSLVLGAGALLLGWELGGVAGGMICWGLYTFAPYHLVNLYVRVNIAEYYAAALAAWVFWGVIAFLRRGGAWAFLGGVVALSILLFTHNIGALEIGVLSVFAVISLLATAPVKRRKQMVLRAVQFYGLAAVLSAHFWLPLLGGRNLVQLERVYTNDLKVDTHFVYPRQLFVRSWGYGMSILGPNDGLSFQIGGVQLQALAVALIYSIAAARKSRRAMGTILCVIGVGVLAFLTTHFSAPFWGLLPLYGIIQFPWRLLMPIALLLAMAVALSVPVTIRHLGERRTFLYAFVLAGAAILLALPYCKARELIPSTKDFRQLIDTQYHTTTVSDDYRPANVRYHDALMGVFPRKLSVNGRALDAPALPPARLGMAMDIPLELASQGKVTLPVYWFPNWKVEVNGMPVEARPTTNLALVGFDLPPGRHRISVRWVDTPVQAISEILTLLGLAFTLLLFVRLRRRSSLPMNREHAHAAAEL